MEDAITVVPMSDIKKLDPVLPLGFESVFNIIEDILSQ